MQPELEQLQHVKELVLFSIGKTPVTAGGLAAALLTMVVAIVAARLIGLALGRARAKVSRGGAALYIVEKLSTYGLIVVGVIAGVSTLGVDLSSLAVFGGALGVGVGLGLQGVVKEFVSGIVLIFDEELRVGDYIELESGQRGVVHEIGARATRIRNNDSVDILIPNSQLIQGTVTNWTLRGHTRRIRIPFRAAYNVDKEKVRDAVLEAAKAVPFTLPDSATYRTQVWLVGFGDSALNYELVVWPRLEAVKRPNAIQAAYTWAIDDALRNAGIEVPMPQRDLHVRSIFGEEADDARRTLKLESAGGGATKGRRRRASTNDAIEDTLAPGHDDPDAGGTPAGAPPPPQNLSQLRKKTTGTTPMKTPRGFFKPLAIGAPQPLRELPVRVERMIHFVPAHLEKVRAKVPEIAPTVDVILGNLEDAIPADAKDAARAGFIEMANATDFAALGVGLWTRINCLNSPWHLQDVTDIVAGVGDRLDVMMVPKVEGPWDIHYMDQLLALLEAKHGLKKPILLHAILETAEGVNNVEAICAASPRMQGISLGPADLAASRRMKTTRVGGGHPFYKVIEDPRDDGAPRQAAQQDIWHYTFAKMVDACAAHGISAFYGPFGDISDGEACEQQFRNAFLLGCVGAWSLHPNQIAIAKKVFSPDPGEVIFAKRILDAMPDGTGVVMLDGKMQDDATWKQAKVMVDCARQIAAKDPEYATLYGF